MKYDVVALGELLIDFIENGKSPQGNTLFEASPGGAPCNVLAMLEKLGYKTAFIGKVGNDSFGKRLGKILSDLNISICGLKYDNSIPTTLAFVHNKLDGDREFSFYRSPGADLMLNEQEVQYELIQKCKIFHFGSLSMTADPARKATKEAVRCAKKAGKLISFDPNLRKPLWEKLEEAASEIWYGIEQCDILKIADDEIRWLTGEHDFDEGIRIIKEKAKVTLINVTLGKGGSICYYGNWKVFAEPFLNSYTIDTTGAGDTFCACILGEVLKYGLENLSELQIYNMLLRANAAASIVTTRKGAIRSMPEPIEIDNVVNKRHIGNR
nr:carbohydrate kinase [uncultured Faecalimonas sp.]